MREVLGKSSEGGTFVRDGNYNRNAVTQRYMGLERLHFSYASAQASLSVRQRLQMSVSSRCLSLLTGKLLDFAVVCQIAILARPNLITFLYPSLSSLVASSAAALGPRLRWVIMME